jgi:hypothetical protein
MPVPVTGTGALTLQPVDVAGQGALSGAINEGIGTIWPLKPLPFPAPWPKPQVYIFGRGALQLPTPAVAGLGDNVENEDWLLLI